MSQIDEIIDSKILGLVKYIVAFGSNVDDTITADPWTPWPFP